LETKENGLTDAEGLEEAVLFFKHVHDEFLLADSGLYSEELIDKANVFCIINAQARLVHSLHLSLWKPLILALQVVSRVSMLLIIK